MGQLEAQKPEQKPQEPEQKPPEPKQKSLEEKVCELLGPRIYTEEEKQARRAKKNMANRRKRNNHLGTFERDVEKSFKCSKAKLKAKRKAKANGWEQLT